jgi:hypothetical protein
MPHTAERISAARRAQIVAALANGEGWVAISRRFRTSEHIVKIIGQQDWQDVAKRKLQIAAQYEQIANKANNRILAKLDSRDDIPLPVLVPVSGMATDKIVALRPQEPLEIHHQHQHIHAHITDSTYAELLNKLPPADPGTD